MNWDAISAICQVLGTLAVVITLLYVAVQVRYAKQAAADQNRLSRATGVREVGLAAVSNEAFRLSMDRNWGLTEHYQQQAQQLGISPDDASRADWGNAYWFWLHWGQFSSTYEHKDRQELENVITTFYRIPGVRNFWETSPLAKPLLDPAFVEFVDRILRSDSAPNR